MPRSRQVWSSESGYPGDYDYREFYKDVGWELAGTIIAYLGFAVGIGSFFALVIVLILMSLLLLYIKLLEEKELEVRFGEEYLAYKRCTPFILPRKPRG